MKLRYKLQVLGVLLTFLIYPNITAAQNAKSSEALISATEEYKASTETVLGLEQQEVSKAESQLELLRELFEDGLIARSELEQSEHALSSAREKLNATRQQVAAADHMIAEIKAADEAAKVRPVPTRTLVRPTASYSSSASIIRHNGPITTVSNLPHINAFFSSRFGRPLPVTAIGQTPTHDRFGLDHRHAVDVPLHPDSAEGKALMEYLQQQGISFLAFRGAIPGVSTGPHIHIGRPSSRL